ncbi:acyl carrier protein [Salipiger mucosus]|uniref:Phosphopantetheine-binding protein n=1 Tax=Salipiger mucosus DSM 16094 TaxID=1123237 RepID=S9QRA3_9RHOB|nr:acyl carrier protein [Salipiger mucosus]EPX82148.1 phosphopantetheine-binding protein [Salipiger mucosus DSM 16094]
MTEDDIRRTFLDLVTRVAPDLATDDIGGDDHLQDDLELDSMDVLNLVAAIHERLGVDVPEADYMEIATPNRAVTYLSGRLD